MVHEFGRILGVNAYHLLISLLVLAQEAPQKPLLLRLDGATRAKVLAAMAALIILGFLMIALTWLGARWTRRYMGPRLKPTVDGLAVDAEWARGAQPPKETKEG